MGANGVYSNISGSYLQNSGSITGGGGSGVYIRAGGNIVNSGTIKGSTPRVPTPAARALFWRAAPISITQPPAPSSADIATPHPVLGWDLKSGTVTNHGHIYGGGGGAIGVDAAGMLDNLGTIAGGYAEQGGGIGVSLSSSGTLRTEAGSKMLGGAGYDGNGGTGLVVQQGALALNSGAEPTCSRRTGRR